MLRRAPSAFILINPFNSLDPFALSLSFGKTWKDIFTPSCPRFRLWLVQFTATQDLDIFADTTKTSPENGLIRKNNVLKFK